MIKFVYIDIGPHFWQEFESMFGGQRAFSWKIYRRFVTYFLFRKGERITIKYMRKSYDELKAEMEAIQQEMIEAKKNKRANALKEVKRLCKKFGCTNGMLRDSLAKRRSLK